MGSERLKRIGTSASDIVAHEPPRRWSRFLPSNLRPAEKGGVHGIVGSDGGTNGRPILSGGIAGLDEKDL